MPLDHSGRRERRPGLPRLFEAVAPLLRRHLGDRARAVREDRVVRVVPTVGEGVAHVKLDLNWTIISWSSWTGLWQWTM